MANFLLSYIVISIHIYVYSHNHSDCTALYYARSVENRSAHYAGLSSLGVPGAMTPQILVNQLTLSQPGWADYAHQKMPAPPNF